MIAAFVAVCVLTVSLIANHREKDDEVIRSVISRAVLCNPNTSLTGIDVVAWVAELEAKYYVPNDIALEAVGYAGGQFEDCILLELRKRMAELAILHVLAVQNSGSPTLHLM
jgi:hypothetical protein